MLSVGQLLSTRRSPLKRVCIIIVAGFALIAPLGLGAFYWAETAMLRDWSRKSEVIEPLPEVRRVVEFFEGIPTPPTLTAAEATLADDEPVIGIEVGGKSRAYRLRAMRGFTDHVVNDVVDGVAVTVTYCDIADCVRAFGGGDHQTPLDIAQGGLMDQRMVLRIGHAGYLQETGELIETDKDHPAVPFPYAEFPSTRTTWGEWKTQHPDTDVYEGLNPDE